MPAQQSCEDQCTYSKHASIPMAAVQQELRCCQPSSSERLAEALTARMSAPRTPLVSSSAMPLMVVPAGEATLSFSTAGCVMLPSSDDSKIYKTDCLKAGCMMYLN